MTKFLKSEYGQDLDITEEEYVDVFETAWYKETKSKMTPGDILKVDRENAGLTQQKLGLKLGKFSRQYISDLENGRKNIMKDLKN